MVPICCRIIFCTTLFTCVYCYIGSGNIRRYLEALDRSQKLETPTRELSNYVVKNSRHSNNLNARRMKSEDGYIQKLKRDSSRYRQFLSLVDAANTNDNQQELWNKDTVYSFKNSPYGVPRFPTSGFDVDSYSRRMFANTQDKIKNIDVITGLRDRHYDPFQDFAMKVDPFYISPDKEDSQEFDDSYKTENFDQFSKFPLNPLVPSDEDWRDLLSTEESEDKQAYNKEQNPKGNQGSRSILNNYSAPPSIEELSELVKQYRAALDSRNVNARLKEVQPNEQRFSNYTSNRNYAGNSFGDRENDGRNRNDEINFKQHGLISQSISNGNINGKASRKWLESLSKIKDIYHKSEKISNNKDQEIYSGDKFENQSNEKLRSFMETSSHEPLKRSRIKTILTELNGKDNIRKVHYSINSNIYNPENKKSFLYNITRQKDNSSYKKPLRELSGNYIEKKLLRSPEKRTHTEHKADISGMGMKRRENENTHGATFKKSMEHHLNNEDNISSSSDHKMKMMESEDNNGETSDHKMKMDGEKSNDHKMKMDGKHMDMDKMKRLMEGYKYHVMLDITSKLMFCWNVNYSNKTVSIRVTCQLSPDYWFGVGFSDYGEITDADMVVFWNDPVDTHHLQDSYTNSNGVLFSDFSQDYTLHKARTEDGLSVLEYTRPFDTCDDQDYLLDNGTTHIVYFVSKGKPASCVGKDVRDMRHGFQRVQLLKPDVHLPPLPTDVWTFEIKAPNVTVPGTETTYWWYITTLPKLHHKQHIVRYEGVIQKENEDIVHHIEVFHCIGRKHVKPYSGPKVPEGKMSPKSDLARCRNVIGAWAMGAEPIIYPEEAGSPIGGTDFSPFVLLEVHYHNPHLQTGHVDRSGIRFYVTPALRKYDMGIMELGLEYTDKMSIPPKQDTFTLSGYCIAECTQLALPKDGINIFASQLHTHLTGKRVWTKHIRDGRELPEVNRDNHYSPHFQEVRVMPRPVNILPGDALVTECVDSTKFRSNVTYGGFSITEEMCVNYIHYYPKVNLEVCKSSISDNALQNFFYFMKRLEGVPIIPSKGIKYNYDVIPWFPLNVKLLDYVYQTSPISMQCNQSNGERFPGVWEGVESTKIQTPLIPAQRECNV